ncbi:DUF6531 domain-containing protein, partial [Clostridium sp. DJ247]|uniref:DUF6531 domain-containing protein n=1 Tax=Clostridium sp. DJ247 TaxID=2726188 RepID=UPI00162A02C7
MGFFSGIVSAVTSVVKAVVSAVVGTVKAVEKAVSTGDPKDVKDAIDSIDKTIDTIKNAEEALKKKAKKLKEKITTGAGFSGIIPAVGDIIQDWKNDMAAGIETDLKIAGDFIHTKFDEMCEDIHKKDNLIDKVKNTIDNGMKAGINYVNRGVDQGFKSFEDTFGINDKNSGFYKYVKNGIKQDIGIVEGLTEGAEDLVVGTGALLIKYGDPGRNILRFADKAVDIYKNPDKYINDVEKFYNGVSTVVTHPKETLTAIGNGLENLKNEMDADPYKRGQITGQAAFFVASFFVGAGEANAVSKASKVEKLAGGLGELDDIANTAGKLGNLRKEEQVFNIDPVNVSTGSFYLESTDLAMEDRGPDINIRRSYNSKDNSIGAMGRGWTFEYESRIKRKDESEIIVVYPDGHIEIFMKTENGWENQSYEDKNVLLQDIEKGEFNLTLKDKTTYKYDKQGKLVSISDRNNNTIIIDYDGEGNIETMISPGGKKLFFKYNYGKIVEIADNVGRKTAYEYDGDNLINVYFPNEGVLIYTYKDNLITAITDQDGNTYVKNEYDESGRVIKQYDREGNIIDVEYNDKDMENTFIHRSTGLVEKYRYNSKNLVIEQIYSDGTNEVFTYDKYNNKESEIDRHGRKINRVYDSMGNLLEEVQPGGGVCQESCRMIFGVVIVIFLTYIITIEMRINFDWINLYF